MNVAVGSGEDRVLVPAGVGVCVDDRPHAGHDREVDVQGLGRIPAIPDVVWNSRSVPLDIATIKCCSCAASLAPTPLTWFHFLASTWARVRALAGAVPLQVSSVMLPSAVAAMTWWTPPVS